MNSGSPQALKTRYHFWGLAFSIWKANVEITIFSKTLAPHPTLDALFVKDMIITADEADYDPLSGEIKPQGHVAVKLQNAAK
jgi:hypothetical protein